MGTNKDYTDAEFEELNEENQVYPTGERETHSNREPVRSVRHKSQSMQKKEDSTAVVKTQGRSVIGSWGDQMRAKAEIKKWEEEQRLAKAKENAWRQMNRLTVENFGKILESDNKEIDAELERTEARLAAAKKEREAQEREFRNQAHVDELEGLRLERQKVQEQVNIAEAKAKLERLGRSETVVYRDKLEEQHQKKAIRDEFEIKDTVREAQRGFRAKQVLDEAQNQEIAVLVLKARREGWSQEQYDHELDNIIDHYEQEKRRL